MVSPNQQATGAWRNDATAIAALIPQVRSFVATHMGNYDASHNYEHIERVLGIARTIEATERRDRPQVRLDSNLITLASMLHDIGDRKYLARGEDGSTLVEQALLRFGADAQLAQDVQTIVNLVSFTQERDNPAPVKAALSRYPELAVVQDADRLDALGAHGIGRIFTFNTARGASTMQVAFDHIDDKLLDREMLMKTAKGKEMAKVRCERLRLFQSWWMEEEALRLCDEPPLNGQAGVPRAS